jgi:hypothetical protein
MLFIIESESVHVLDSVVCRSSIASMRDLISNFKMS